MPVPIVAFFAFFFLTGAILNYLDTGKIYKILPGHRMRFWLASVGMGLLASFFSLAR